MGESGAFALPRAHRPRGFRSRRGGMALTGASLQDWASMVVQDALAVVGLEACLFATPRGVLASPSTPVSAAQRRHPSATTERPRSGMLRTEMASHAGLVEAEEKMRRAGASQAARDAFGAM